MKLAYTVVGRHFRALFSFFSRGVFIPIGRHSTFHSFAPFLEGAGYDFTIYDKTFMDTVKENVRIRNVFNWPHQAEIMERSGRSAC